MSLNVTHEPGKTYMALLLGLGKLRDGTRFTVSRVEGCLAFNFPGEDGTYLVDLQDVADEVVAKTRAKVRGIRLRGRPCKERILVTCLGCGKARNLLLSEARRLKTNYCHLCWLGNYHRQRSPNPKQLLKCPQCGKERWASPWRAKQRKTQYCRVCWANKRQSEPPNRLEKALHTATNTTELREALGGVSRQRVHQLLNKCGMTLPSRTAAPHDTWVCARCGQERSVTVGDRPKGNFCRACLHERANVTLHCPDCGEKRRVLKKVAALYKSELCHPCWSRRWGQEMGAKVGRNNLLAANERRQRLYGQRADAS